jgi:hypothetical protein
LYDEEVTVSDTASIGNIHWRDFFTDPYLQDLIEKGLAQNTDVQTASLRVEEAKASLLSAKLAFLPSFALSPQGGINTVEGSKASHTYTLPVTASWELDIFGKLRNAKRTFKKLEYTDEEYAQEIQKIHDRFVPFLNICKENHTAIRIGVNHGSLSDRIMSRYGDTPAGMVESCMEFLHTGT